VTATFNEQHVLNTWRSLIDSSLDWSSHVQYIKSKLVRTSYLFYKLQIVISVDVLKMFYFSLVHCHLKYCIVSWGTDTYSVLQPIEVVKNNILRTNYYIKTLDVTLHLCINLSKF